MLWLGVLWRRLVFLLRSRRFDADLDEQMQLHIELRAEALKRSGLPAEDAERAARRAFGSRLRHREDSRSTWGWTWLDTLCQDVRYGGRVLRTNTSLTLVLVATLGLGIGMTTVIFSMLDAIEWQALPYPERPRLAVLEIMPGTDKRLERPSQNAFEQWRAHGNAFDRMAAWQTTLFAVGEGDPAPVAGQRVSCDFFATLGVQPVVGRSLQAGDCQVGAEAVAVIAEGMWRSTFAGRPDIVGQIMVVDARRVRIVGVMARRFRGFLDGAAARVWMPLAGQLSPAERAEPLLGVIARVRTGRSLGALRDEATRLLRDGSLKDPRASVVVRTLDNLASQGLGPAARILIIAACLVLLVACSNAASLLLARGLSRSREIAARRVLGATRLRLVRQFLVEACLLGFLGGVLGLAVASGLLGLLASIGHDLFAQMGVESLAVNVRAATFTLAISLATGFICGLWPALRASDVKLRLRLHDTVDAGRSVGRAKSLLVSWQVAVALVLVSASVLLLRSFTGIIDATREPGFRTADVVTFVAASPADKAAPSAARVALQDLLSRVSALPGVTSVAVSNRVPLAENAPWVTVSSQRGSLPQARAAYRVIDGEYLPTLGLALRAGRPLTSSDHAGQPAVAMMNEALARRFGGLQAAIGRVVTIAGTPRTIVGVIADAGAPRAGEAPAPEVLVPAGQQAELATRVLVRSAIAPDRMVLAIRTVLRDVAPGRPAPEVRSIAAMLAASLRGLNFFVALAVGFGGLAVLLTLVGICGLVSYGVAGRTREIGVRVALGAPRRAVLHLVLRQALGRTLVGAVVGLAGTLAVSRVLPSRLFGVHPASPLLVVGLALLFVLAALGASLLPARRALNIDPMKALRVE